MTDSLWSACVCLTMTYYSSIKCATVQFDEISLGDENFYGTLSNSIHTHSGTIAYAHNIWQLIGCVCGCTVESYVYIFVAIEPIEQLAVVVIGYSPEFDRPNPEETILNDSMIWTYDGHVPMALQSKWNVLKSYHIQNVQKIDISALPAAPQSTECSTHSAFSYVNINYINGTSNMSDERERRRRKNFFSWYLNA